MDSGFVGFSGGVPDPDAVSELWKRVAACKSRKFCFNCRTSGVHIPQYGLCSSCQKTLSRAKCKHCDEELYLHALHRKVEALFGRVSCFKCAKLLENHGLPRKCGYCQLWSAFAENQQCTRCVDAERLYGPPVPCEGCGVQAAFRREADKLQKTDGKLLCYSCIVKYKGSKRQRESEAAADSAKHPRLSPFSPSCSGDITPRHSGEHSSRWDVTPTTASPGTEQLENQLRDLETTLANERKEVEKERAQSAQIKAKLENDLRDRDAELTLLRRRLESEKVASNRKQLEWNSAKKAFESRMVELEAQRTLAEEQVLNLKLRKEMLESQQRNYERNVKEIQAAADQATHNLEGRLHHLESVISSTLSGLVCELSGRLTAYTAVNSACETYKELEKMIKSTDKQVSQNSSENGAVNIREHDVSKAGFESCEISAIQIETYSGGHLSAEGISI